MSLTKQLFSLQRAHSRLGKCATAFALISFLLVGVTFVDAGSINYGDFSDIPPGSVMYLDVTESSGTDPVPPPLFGAPSITGNLLDFDPPGFVSTTTGGPLDVTDGQLNFTMMAARNSGFYSLAISEWGDYSFAGSGAVGTSVSASVSVRVEILEIDNVVLPSPIVISSSNTFATDMASEGGPTDGLESWSLNVLADLSPVLHGALLGATKAEVVINNQLISNSESDSLAFIAKKDFKLIPGTEVPEPASLLLVGLAGCCMAIRRR